MRSKGDFYDFTIKMLFVFLISLLISEFIRTVLTKKKATTFVEFRMVLYH